MSAYIVQLFWPVIIITDISKFSASLKMHPCIYISCCQSSCWLWSITSRAVLLSVIPHGFCHFQTLFLCVCVAVMFLWTCSWFRFFPVLHKALVISYISMFIYKSEMEHISESVIHHVCFLVCIFYAFTWTTYNGMIYPKPSSSGLL